MFGVDDHFMKVFHICRLQITLAPFVIVDFAWVSMTNHINSVKCINPQMSNIRHNLLGNKIVDHSYAVGALSDSFAVGVLPVGTAPTTYSFFTQHLASTDWAKKTARQNKKHKFWDLMCLILEVWRYPSEQAPLEIWSYALSYGFDILHFSLAAPIF